MNPEDAPNAGSGRRRAAAFLLSCLCLTLALAATTVHYTVGVEGGRVVVDAMGHRFLGPPVDTGEPLLVLFLSQGRHSTGQTLMRDRGALVNGLRALAFIAGRNHERPQEFRVPLAERWSFVHFNPFRSTLSVRVGEPELRLEVNIPDASIEAWDRGTKHDTVQLRSPWLRLTIAPLLAALAAAVCLLAGLGVWPRRIRTLAPRAPRPEVPGPPSRTAAEASLIGAAGALLVGAVLIGAFDAMPGFGDEMNYLIQGKIFASGRLWVPPPPEPEFYRVGWMDMQGADGKVWGFHPPGNSALLALGWLAGVHWLTVPLVGGALLAVQYLLGLELFRRRSAAWIHVGLVATSHYVLSLASSFMAHAPSLLLLSLFLLFLLRFDDRGRGRDLVLAAVCSGLAFTVRPLSAVLAAVVPLVAIAPRLRRRHLGAALASLALGMTLVASVFAYTWGITGSWELPYLVKGPEAGQTLSVRLAKGVDVHLANLYRNSNELQHRAHSFGILGNAVLFFVGLLAAGRGSGRRRLRIAASSFVFFVVAHSVLHWYGWKWEPRMLYDVSFLAFLVSAAGLAALLSAPGRGRPARALAAVAALAALGWVALFDLPGRLTTEYKNYNGAAVEARREVAARGIRDAVVFFEDEVPFSCYTPFNGLDGGGDVVYARHRGDLADYRLLSRFPGKRYFITKDGRGLAERPNFYRGDAARLAGELGRLGAERATTVVPWRAVAPAPLLERLPGSTADVSTFLDGLPRDPGSPSGARLVSLVGGAAGLAQVLDALLITTTPAAGPFEGPLEIRSLAGPRGGRFERLPGIRMTCFGNATWAGEPIAEQLAAGFDADPCPGEDRSIVFAALFDLERERRFRFSLDSDDGSGLWLDGNLVIDNDLASTHGPQLKAATHTLEPGRHELVVKYFNGPGDARLRVLVDDRDGNPRPFTVATFADEFYLFVEPSAAGVVP